MQRTIVYNKFLSDSFKENYEDGVTLKEIPFEETRLYVQKVLQYKETYEKLYGGIENG